MSDDQAETVEAPWGINPKTGKPYKADPEKMRGLRGLRTAKSSDGPKAPTPRGQTPPKPPTAANLSTYAGKFRSWFRFLTRFAGARNQVDGLIMTAQAEALAQAWGQVAVDYPKFGRFIDRTGGIGSLGEAVSLTVMTAGMVAANHGLLDNSPVGELFAGMIEETLVNAGFATRPAEPQAA